MSEQKLGTFKIGDTQRAGVSAPKKAVRGPSSVEPSSMGFRRIEAILDNEDPAKVGESLNKLHAQLQEKQSEPQSHRERAAANKAMIAVERAIDLLDYLFHTKASLQS